MVKTENFILRYSNCWEDADLLLSQLQHKQNGNFCSVASGGDNSLSLLTLDPALLVIVDVNPKQLYLTELKASAIRHLEYEDCLSFLGFEPSTIRSKTYNLLRKDLTAEARAYWDANGKKVDRGIVHSGSTEANIQTFSRWVRPLIHNDKKVDELMRTKTKEKQATFYQKKWNNWVWKTVFSLFFSRLSMKAFAPDPDFLNYYKGNIADYLFNKTAAHFSDPICQSNHILHYILKGTYGDHLPHYVRKENFAIIRDRLSAIRYYHGFAEEPASHYGKFQAFNLSNIFEYTTPKEFEDLSHKLLSSAVEECLYIYWNILMPRKMSKVAQDQIVNLVDTSIAPLPDKCWLYSACIVDKKIC